MMSESQIYLRGLLIDEMVKGAIKLNTPIKSRRDIVRVVNTMSDYEVCQIWAEAYHYARLQYPDLPPPKSL